MIDFFLTRLPEFLWFNFNPSQNETRKRFNKRQSLKSQKTTIVINWFLFTALWWYTWCSNKKLFVLTRQQLFILLFPTKLYWWAFLRPNLRVCCFCRFFLRHQIKKFRFTFLFFWSIDISIYISANYKSNTTYLLKLYLYLSITRYHKNIIDETLLTRRLIEYKHWFFNR